MKSLKTYSLLILTVAQGIFTTSIRAQEVKTLSVEELFRLGIENSLQIKAGQINQHIADQNEKSARTERLPEINIGAAGSYSGNPTVFTRGLSGAEHPDFPDWSQSYKAEIIQPLYQGGRIRHTVTGATLSRQLAGLSLQRDKSELRLFLMEQYLNLFELYKEKKVFRQNIAEAGQRLHDIRQKRKEGMLTQNDVLRSELLLTNYELAFRESENNITIVSQQLNIILGLDENTILYPDTTLLETQPPFLNYEEYLNQAADNYPELKIARYNTTIARENVSIALSDYYPMVSLSLSDALGRPLTNTSPVQDLFMNSWNLSLTLSYRLASLYKSRSHVMASRETVLLQQNQEEQLHQRLRMNIKSAFIKHKEALDRVAALTLSVGQANENYRIVQNKYLNQLAILTDLLDASSVRLDAELQLTTAKTNVIYTYYQLLRATGKL